MKKLIFYSALLMILTVSCHKNPNDNDVIPTENLVAYYPFNGNANDESGHLNNGTVHGATMTEDRFGNPNRAYYFDGINDFIEAQHSESLNIVGPITICVWIKTNISNAFGLGIVNKVEHTRTERDGYMAYVGFGTSTFGMNITNNWYITGGHNCDSKEIISDNKWHFCVALYDRRNVKIYLDGILSNSNICTQDMDSNNESLLIGNDPNPSFISFFKGAIDDIRIYNTALTEQEIEVLFKENKTNDNY
ncbi:MAG: LamG domain-containing protein [Bacteroidota bacterium]